MSEPTMFVHGEVELAAATGLAVKHFQKKRAKNLRQSADWDLNCLRVAYTKNAVPTILGMVTGRAVQAPELAMLLEKSLLEIGEKNAAETVTGTISKFFMNPHMMQVTLPTDATVTVKVRTRDNFKLGMEIPLRQTTAEGRTVWILARKLPRFPGRW